MRIVINHDSCQHGGAYADRCLAATIRHPLGHERLCTAEIVEDGQAELTVVLIVDDQTYALTFHDELQREIAESWGVVAFTEPESL